MWIGLQATHLFIFGVKCGFLTIIVICGIKEYKEKVNIKFGKGWNKKIKRWMKYVMEVKDIIKCPFI